MFLHSSDAARGGWLALAIVAASLGLAACNTMEGAGEDIEAAGDAIGDEAEEHDTY